MLRKEEDLKIFLSIAEIKYCNGKVNGHNSFNQLVNNDIRYYEDVRKIAIAHGVDNTTGC